MREGILQKGWIRWTSTILVVGMMILIFVFSSQGQEQSEGLSFPIGDKVIESGALDGVKDAVEAGGDTFFHFIQVLVRKLAHVAIYAVLGAGLFVCYESWLGAQKLNWLWSMVIGIVYAATDEWHQSTVPGRTGSMEDVLIDGAGVIVGVLVALLAVWLIWKRKQKKAEEPGN